MGVKNEVSAVAEGSSLAGARHCLPIGSTGGIGGPLTPSFSFGSVVMIPSGQSGSGQAGLNGQFFASADCKGSLMAATSSPFVTTVGSWRPVLGKANGPASSKSVALRLVVLKPFSEPPLQAHFDDLLIKSP